jgi:putative nucleotidyltransferase-like protein/transglutaminase superfamily protein
MTALAADAMLRRRGLPSLLKIGVAPGGSERDRFQAHAWVTSNGLVVAGEVDGLAEYIPFEHTTARTEEALAAIVRGEPVSWQALGLTAARVTQSCARHDLAGVILDTLRGPAGADWPADIVDALERDCRGAAAIEAVRRRELMTVLEALAAEGVRPVLFKGAALAYDVYISPAARPRNDVDLLIRREELEPARRVMQRLGYASPAYCDGDLIFCQVEMSKRDALGIDHAFDFHWKISTQVVFADALTYEEALDESEPLPALGRHAVIAGPVHALLIACIHPAMHHRNEERLLWIYDVHLLASRLSAPQLERFSALAIEKRVAAVCARQLQLARNRFGTHMPDDVLDALASPPSPEATARYLQSGRRWHHELVASIRGLPGWRDRLQLAREVLLPNREYMLAAYGVPQGARHAAVLPALYVHRAVSGAWKVLRGKK